MLRNCCETKWIRATGTRPEFGPADCFLWETGIPLKIWMIRYTCDRMWRLKSVTFLFFYSVIDYRLSERQLSGDSFSQNFGTLTLVEQCVSRPCYKMTDCLLSCCTVTMEAVLPKRRLAFNTLRRQSSSYSSS